MVRAIVWILLLASAPAAARELSAGDVDRLLAKEWKKSRLAPAPPTDDAHFLRRLYLDLAGVIPPAEVVDAFLDDGKPGKRERAVDSLLESAAYSDHFTNYWDRVLMGRQVFSPLVDRTVWRAWLHGEIEKNTAWDELVRKLVGATGQNSPGGPRMGPGQGTSPTVVSPDASKINGATNWILKYTQQPQDLTGKMSRAFLGVQIQCAQCHDHKSEKWKQDDFRRLAACFAKTGPLPVDGEKVQGIRRVELKDFPVLVFGKPRMDKELKAIAEAPPAALDGTDFSATVNRRQALAEWITSAGNPWFARAFVNRLWAYFLGRGFVEPIDDFRRSNPVVAPAILDALATDFRAHKYDVKRLVKLICSTRAYQLSSAPVKSAEPEKLWARYRLRALGPDELLDSVAAATHVEALMQKVAGASFDKQRLQLRNVVTFLFDVDEELEQREFEGTVPQALMLLNGLFVNSGASALPGTTLTDVLAMPLGDEKKIEALYLRTLSRRPSAAELQRWTELVNAPREVVDTGPVKRPPRPTAGEKNKLARKMGAGPDPLARLGPKLKPGEMTAQSQAYEDLFWALLNSSEFYFRH